MSAPSAAGVYALLADGTTVEIREAGVGDFDAVREMHRAMSPDSTYLRFFSMSTAAAEREARRICREPAADHAALLAWLAGELIGVASYEARSPAREAEIAFAVADRAHHRGVATLLLEHLVSAARDQGVRTFTAEVLAENSAMLQVFADAGLRARRKTADGVTELAFDLPGDDADPGWEPYFDAVAAREGRADVASLRPVLAAESVAVVGASRRPESVGRSILHNIVTGGYTGRVYAVNPHADELEDVPCVPSPAALPEPVDLAVISVPAPALLGAAEECGKRGIRALVVITSGLDAAGRAALLACCRRHGMRLVGPNCFGVAVPGIGLDATFAASHPASGIAGLAVQSGGVGIALLEQFTRLGIGISSFASLGDKSDVSGNDLLAWWEQDPATRLAVLYLESLGNPRKFGRTARHVGASMPILTVDAGRSEAAQRAAASHTGHPRGAVRAGRHHRHPRRRRADRGGGAAGQPAGARRGPGRDRVQRGRGGGAGRRRVLRRGPARGGAGQERSGRATPAAAARRGGRRAGRYHGSRGTGRVPPLPRAGRGGRRRGRGPSAHRAHCDR